MPGAEITVFKSLGIAVEDLAAARLVLSALGISPPIPLSYELLLFAGEEVRSITTPKTIRQPGMATVGRFSFLAELQNHDVANVQFPLGIERNSSFAEIRTGARIGFLRKNSVTENAQRDGKLNALPAATVE